MVSMIGNPVLLYQLYPHRTCRSPIQILTYFSEKHILHYATPWPNRFVALTITEGAGSRSANLRHINYSPEIPLVEFNSLSPGYAHL